MTIGTISPLQVLLLTPALIVLLDGICIALLTIALLRMHRNPKAREPFLRLTRKRTHATYAAYVT